MAETPGNLLSTARQSLALTQEDIAKKLRLSSHVIRAIESDTYDRFGSVTYVQGYLRHYARIVNVSEDKILAAWKSMTGDTKLTTPVPSVVSHEVSHENTPQHQQSPLSLRTIMVPSILLILIAFVWWINQKPVPAIPMQPLVEKTQVEAIKPTSAPPVNMTANAEPPVKIKPLEINKMTGASTVKHKKHNTLMAHHAEKPLSVTYTIKPVSPAELASDT